VVVRDNLKNGWDCESNIVPCVAAGVDGVRDEAAATVKLEDAELVALATASQTGAVFVAVDANVSGADWLQVPVIHPHRPKRVQRPRVGSRDEGQRVNGNVGQVAFQLPDDVFLLLGWTDELLHVLDEVPREACLQDGCPPRRKWGPGCQPLVDGLDEWSRRSVFGGHAGAHRSAGLGLEGNLVVVARGGSSCGGGKI